MMPRLYITFDIHGPGEGGVDEAYLREEFGLTELQAASEISRLADTHGIPVTFFVSGRAAAQEPQLTKALAERDSVRIGGHTYRSLRPTWLHLLFDRVTGSFYGPRIFQKYDIDRTLTTLEEISGRPVRSWRTHSFQGDETTLEVLARSSVTHVSERVGPSSGERRTRNELTRIPVNTPPDYDHLYRGWFKPTNVERDLEVRDQLFRAPAAYSSLAGAKRLAIEVTKKITGFQPPRKAFGERWMHPPAYRRWLLGEVERRLDTVGFATVLLHPATMMLADELETADQLLRQLSEMAPPLHLDESP
jgi:hypothetical protein